MVNETVVRNLISDFTYSCNILGKWEVCIYAKPGMLNHIFPLIVSISNPDLKPDKDFLLTSVSA